MLPLCRDQGVGAIPWSPLARGCRGQARDAGTEAAGRDRPASPPAVRPAGGRAVVDALDEVAADRGLPPAAVRARVAAAPPAVTAPIVGATRAEHLDDAIAAVQISC